jgi:hypothetical protein
MAPTDGTTDTKGVFCGTSSGGVMTVYYASATGTFDFTPSGGYDGQSGLAGYALTVGGSPTWELTDLSKTGGIITVYAIDNVDNGSSVNFTLSPEIDNILPSAPTAITSFIRGYNSSGTTYYCTSEGIIFTPTVAADVGSGIAGFATNAAGTENFSNSTATTITLTGTTGLGTTYTLYTVDNVGNVSGAGNSVTLILDSVDPTLGYTASSVSDTTIWNLYPDDALSGLDSAATRCLTSPGTYNSQQITGLSSIPNNTSDYYDLVLRDNAGNAIIYRITRSRNGSGVYTVSVDAGTDENTWPTINGSLAATSTGVTGINCADTQSGIDTGSYASSTGTFNGSAITGLSALAADGDFQDITISVKDYAGNKTIRTIRRTRVASSSYTAAFLGSAISARSTSNGASGLTPADIRRIYGQGLGKTGGKTGEGNSIQKSVYSPSAAQAVSQALASYIVPASFSLKASEAPRSLISSKPIASPALKPLPSPSAAPAPQPNDLSPGIGDSTSGTNMSEPAQVPDEVASQALVGAASSMTDEAGSDIADQGQVKALVDVSASLKTDSSDSPVRANPVLYPDLIALEELSTKSSPVGTEMKAGQGQGAAGSGMRLPQGQGDGDRGGGKPSRGDGMPLLSPQKTGIGRRDEDEGAEET